MMKAKFKKKKTRYKQKCFLAFSFSYISGNLIYFSRNSFILHSQMNCFFFRLILSRKFLSVVDYDMDNVNNIKHHYINIFISVCKCLYLQYKSCSIIIKVLFLYLSATIGLLINVVS
jgi:hypothetical protein